MPNQILDLLEIVAEQQNLILDLVKTLPPAEVTTTIREKALVIHEKTTRLWEILLAQAEPGPAASELTEWELNTILAGLARELDELHQARADNTGSGTTSLEMFIEMTKQLQEKIEQWKNSL